jgi:hypothetical protein
VNVKSREWHDGSEPSHTDSNSKSSSDFILDSTVEKVDEGTEPQCIPKIAHHYDVEVVCIMRMRRLELGTNVQADDLFRLLTR